MKQMTLIEMDGFLKGKCIPRDLKVNETNAEYLVLKFAEAEAKCAALASENAGLKAAFDKPQAYLSWHTIPPTWEDPLPCGEYLDVHDDAGHKNSDGTDCWPVYAKPEINTPATDAFLAEVRAQGLNAFIQHRSAELDAHIKNGGEQFDEKSVRIRDIIVSARLFREPIRKEAAQ